MVRSEDYSMIGESPPSLHPEGVQPPKSFIWHNELVGLLVTPGLKVARWVPEYQDPEVYFHILHYYKPTGNYSPEMGYEYAYSHSSDGIWV